MVLDPCAIVVSSSRPRRSSGEVEAARQAIRRHPLRGLLALARWMVNPVSVKGAASLNTVTYATGGPDIVEQIARMEEDEQGRRVLAERPELASTLSDSAALAALAPGSVGRTYQEFMDRPEVVPPRRARAAHLPQRGFRGPRLGRGDEVPRRRSASGPD